MKIDRDLILRLEKLAMLELSDEERGTLQSEMNDMLGMISKLEELDTTNVKPLIHMTEAKNVFRTDEVQGQVSTADALKNAPNANESFFNVPKVIK
jgi:aspartyl-tRNA(Asn)/glutamyl-tRNA(Gln) amidotransferase subunit C